MNEFTRKYKEDRQKPAPEKVANKKGSCKKVWKFEANWTEEKTFSEHTRKNGVWTTKTYTRNEVLEWKGGKLSRAKYSLNFWAAFRGPTVSRGNYKTKESALTSWWNFVDKGDVQEYAEYRLINKETGETIKL